MRTVTAQIVGAFANRTAAKLSNTQSDGTALYLHGNKIAEFRKDGLYITHAGWQTNTTKERLNGIPGVSISQKKGVWYLNGKAWDGQWVKVSDHVPPLKNSSNVFDLSKEYVKLDGWRGYEKPVHAVAGANDTGGWEDSPCPSHVREAELKAIKQHLAANGIPTKEVVCETSNVFCVHVYLVAYPSQTKQARELVKEYLKNNETRLAYVA